MDYSRRFIDLAGSINFRDFGGYKTRDNRQVRWGKLFRCGALNGIEDGHHDRFADLDIGVICDLRRHDEADEAPTPAHPPYDVRLHIPIDPGSSASMRSAVEQGTDAATLRRFMTDITRELAREHHADYERLFEALLGTERGFLLHCTAGKDRTGFGAALILAALGVDEDTLFVDYLLTNSTLDLEGRVRPRILARYGRELDDDSLLALAGVHREYLEAAMDELHTNHGSLHGYLDEIGIDERTRQVLRDRLLD